MIEPELRAADGGRIDWYPDTPKVYARIGSKTVAVPFTPELARQCRKAGSSEPVMDAAFKMLGEDRLV
ncbi:MAG: hypothetical protein IJ228_10990 [Succinivibrio sp.]|nr:hypothetical protein [Succinivibrio sp.]